MAARKKPEDRRYTRVITLRTTPEMHKQLNDICESKGISIAELARECFERVIKDQSRKK